MKFTWKIPFLAAMLALAIGCATTPPAASPAERLIFADEFDEGVAFAWVIRNFLGGYLGCVYLRPEDNSRAGGKVGIWLRVSETHPERVSGLVGLLKSWMVGLGYDPERHHFIYR